MTDTTSTGEPPRASAHSIDRSATVAEIHGDFVAGLRFKDLGPHELGLAKLLIIDAVASAFAACDSEVMDTLGRVLADEPDGPCRLIGQPLTLGVHPGTAAWINGSLIHALDFDDIPHFGAVELPSALAVLQQRPGSGRDLLTAIVAGFEVAARITAALAHGRVVHPIGLVGPIASTATVCSLLRHDAETVTTAIGIAASHGMGLSQNFGTLTKPLHAGRASESGLLAARLAAAGWSADPMILEGPKGFLAAYGESDATIEAYPENEGFWISRLPADLSGGSRLDPAVWPPTVMAAPPDMTLVGEGAPPDRRRGGPNLRRGPSFKPWPACGGNNAALSAALALFLDPSVDNRAIDRIDVNVPTDPARGAVFRSDPKTGLEGKFSLAYGVASAWLDGSVTVASYTAAGFTRLQQSGLFERVAICVDPDFIHRAPERPSDPDCNWCAVTAHFTDGTHRTTWAFNRGLELGETAVIDKFRFYAARVLGSEAAEASLADLLALEQIDDCAHVIRGWCPGPAAATPRYAEPGGAAIQSWT